MNDTIKRYFELKARNDNKPFMLILHYAYQNGKITDDESLLFCSNGCQKMHGFNMRRVGQIEYKVKGTKYKKFLWRDKVSFVINGKGMSVMKEYVEEERNGIGLSEKDIGSKRWDWAFWSDLLNVMDDGHV